LSAADDLEVVPLRLTDDVLEKLLEFDRDSQAMNFPGDSPNREATAERIRREYAEEPEGMHLVLHRGEIVGCLFMKTKLNPYRRCKFLDLRNIYLTSAYRSKGFGRKLLEVMEGYARRKGCRYLYLGTSAENREARRAFEKFGFKLTRVIMEKDLP